MYCIMTCVIWEYSKDASLEMKQSMKSASPVLGRMRQAVAAGLSSFWNDLIDKGGLPQAGSKTDVVALVSLLCLLIGGAAGLFTNLVVIAQWLPPWLKTWLPLLCAILGVLGSVELISTKEQAREAGSELGGLYIISRNTYRYPQASRNLAKLSLLPLTIFIVTTGAGLYQGGRPISIVYGVLTDGGKGLSGLEVRALSSKGEDLTAKSWQSDVDGFYMIELSRPITRAAYLEVLRPGCPSGGHILRLSVLDEMPRDSLPIQANEVYPVFRHVLSCEDEP
jgi:hypothetical protein